MKALRVFTTSGVIVLVFTLAVSVLKVSAQSTTTGDANSTTIIDNQINTNDVTICDCTPTPTPTRTEEPTPTPTPTDIDEEPTPTPTQKPNIGGPGDGLSDGRSDGKSDGLSDGRGGAAVLGATTDAKRGEVLGASTMAATGSFPTTLASMEQVFGAVLVSLGAGLHGKKKFFKKSK